MENKWIIALHKDGDRMGITAKTMDPRDFCSRMAAILSVLIEKKRFELDWEYQFNGWLWPMYGVTSMLENALNDAVWGAGDYFVADTQPCASMDQEGNIYMDGACVWTPEGGDGMTKANGTCRMYLTNVPERLRRALRIFAAERNILSVEKALIRVLEHDVEIQLILKRLADSARADDIRRKSQQEVKHLIHKGDG